MINLKTAIILSAAATGLFGCGGNEPIGTLQSAGSVQIPTLSLPFLSNTASPTTTAFGAALTNAATNTGFTFHASPISPLQILSPADGVVMNVDNTADATFIAVTIRHTAKLTTRFRLLAGSFVQQGNFVSKGSAIGSGSNNNNTTMAATGQSANSAALMEVFVEGNLVCPLSYFDTASKQSNVLTAGGFGGIAPCIQ